jgi:hypothetical protein
MDPEERGRKLLQSTDNCLPTNMVSYYERLVSSFFSSIEHIAFHLFLSFLMYNRISLKLYFEPSSSTSSLENLDIKSKRSRFGVMCEYVGLQSQQEVAATFPSVTAKALLGL